MSARDTLFLFMPRQDISIDPAYGELSLTLNLTSKRFYDFSFLGSLNGMDNDSYCYAEINVPQNFRNNLKDDYEIRTIIPYIAEYKQLRIRVGIPKGDGSKEYLINQYDNTIWFLVKASDKSSLPISQYRILNEENIYNLVLKDGCLLLFSGNETDLIIKPSLEQNKILLLKASAGNIYQYPQIGVGLMYYLHSNLETSDLSRKLLREFENDQLIIKDAYMNSDTGELYLDVEEKNNG